MLIFLCHRCAKEMKIVEFLTLGQSREEPCFSCEQVCPPHPGLGGFIWARIEITPLDEHEYAP